MAFMNLMAEAVPQLTNIIGKAIFGLYELIGDFGWTVVVFTLIVKLITLPLDFWSKAINRKNSKAMKRMQPQIEKITKQCGGDKMAIQQEQMKLYKKEGYSMFGACLPQIVTLIVFSVIFVGFRTTIAYQNEMIVYNLANTYETCVQEGKSEAERDEILIAQYKDSIDSWYVKNVFMPDSWSNVVPDQKAFEGAGLGQLRAKIPDNVNMPGGYTELMQPIMKAMNKDKFFDMGRWNGYFLLPILSIAVSILSSKTMKQSMPESMGMDEKQKKTQASTMKFMTLLMPLMIGFFAIFYSAAFTIYMFLSSLITSVFQIVYNAVTKKIDDKELDHVLVNQKIRRK